MPRFLLVRRAADNSIGNLLYMVSSWYTLRCPRRVVLCLKVSANNNNKKDRFQLFKQMICFLTPAFYPSGKQMLAPGSVKIPLRRYVG